MNMKNPYIHLIALALTTSPIHAQWIDLQSSIPAPAISGTPVPILLNNLEALQQSIPTLKVPEGTTLLSHGKAVSSSDDWPLIGDLAYLTDGDKETGEGYYVELMPGLQWVQIDLETSHTIQAVWVWHYHGQKRAYHDVVIQLSDDPAFKENVHTVYNNDFDHSAALGQGEQRPYVETHFGKLVAVPSVKARYVRLYSNGNTTNDGNHYIEVEVFGQP
jgi:hypothetical protein